MMIVCMRRRRLLAALGALAALGLLLLLAGCQEAEEPQAVRAADNRARVAYLESLGWQVTEEPLETLSLLLPEDLSGQADYARLQEELGLPFAQCGGKTVTRYTYTVLNYPELPQGVQLNLLLWGDQVIGGDVMSLGENGFQRSLVFPS